MQSMILSIPKLRPDASIRLVCFPYAGGGSATYLPWQHHLDSNVELVIVQLPGRGARFSEAPYQTMTEIVTAIFYALKELDNKPVIFFGHSMGARVAYELTLMLCRYNSKLPVHFIASGSVAPCIKRTKEETHHLPDDEFIAKLIALNGSPLEVLANKELMQLMLPFLRADFKIIETYCNDSKFLIPTKLSILMGDEEEIENHEVEMWFELFENHMPINWVRGGHFFVDKNRGDVLKVVNAIITNYLSHHYASDI